MLAYLIPTRQASNDVGDSRRFRRACQSPQKPLPKQRTGFQSGLSPVHLSLLPRVGRLAFARRHAAESERPPERRGPRPASEGGKPKLTKAPRSLDRGCGNFGRLPIQSAVVGVPREARKREAACLRAQFQSCKASAPFDCYGRSYASTISRFVLCTNAMTSSRSALGTLKASRVVLT